MEWHISVSMRILIYCRHRAPWCRKSYWNEKNISAWYENGKESRNQRGHFLDFYRFSWSYAGPKSNLHPRKKISLIGVTNPAIVYMLLLFQIICIHWFQKKAVTLTENLMELTWIGSNHLKVFRKWMLGVVSVLRVNAFFPIWILFAPDFFCDILSSGYRNRKFQRKVSEFLFVKQNRPTLSKHFTSVPLKLFS